MEKLAKIGICVPWTSPFIWTKFTEAALQVRQPNGTEIKWFFGKGWCPARRHTDALEKALEWGADLMCIFGADQVAPSDIIEKLYARILQGYPVINAMVSSRGYFDKNNGSKPFMPLAWRWTGAKLDENGRAVQKQYRNQQLDPDAMELIKMDGTIQPVHMIGSGCIMFHREHLLSLKKPWFSETYNHENYKRIATMDTIFSWRLIAEAGATMWVDTSIEIGHLHDMMIDSTFQDRFEDWATGAPTAEKEIIRIAGQK